ncbi:hypothetical protein [Caballeronia sordidicola]|uniref:hypothetical protein n=1 Tax=Caballeronia sordidicola TaxID=196367 RepID=UPI000A80CE93|nr:hypothetical protein [Caballeronia sordidicola]
MADDLTDDEITGLTLSLEQHKKALIELADELSVHLQSHAVRHQALYTAAKEIIEKNPAPPEIAEKVNHGGGLGDMDSFAAEQRVWRAQDTVNWIAQELINAQHSPRSKFLLHDLRCLGEIAQLERERAGAVLGRLKARNDYLEKWVLTLTSDPGTRACDRRFHH